MTNQRAFGRRINPLPAPRRARPAIDAAPTRKPEIVEEAFERSLPSPERADSPPRESATPESASVDDELTEWKRARKQRSAFPWRPLYLTASLCFGVASFVLPDSVNSIVEFPLYALAGLSLYAGFRKRRSRNA